MDLPQQRNFTGPLGSLDEDGAGDHGQPYRFGWRPRASAPNPFNTRQYARPLILRSRVQDDCGNDEKAHVTARPGQAA